MADNNSPYQKSPIYKAFERKWKRITTIFAGEDSVKEGKTEYLPKLSGQTDQQYLNYQNRGSFFNAFGRTIDGMTGAILRKEVVIKVDSIIDEFLDEVTIAKESIQEVIKIIVQKVIGYGYFGILVDFPKDATEKSNPYFSLYNPEAILNFRFNRVGEDYLLTLLVLLESRYDIDTDNRFNTVEIPVLRVMELVFEDGATPYVMVSVYEKRKLSSKTEEEWVLVEDPILPSVRGKRLEEIPFVFFGSLTNNPIPDEPPLNDLASLNIKHWQLSCDYYHGLHYCAIPTPWAAGFGTEGELYIGGEKAWVSDNPDAHCGYLEFTGAGLGAIANAMERLERQMAVLGARLLEEQKRQSEAAETVAMRYSGDTATLAGIVTNVEQGLMKALDYLGMWKGREVSSEVRLNRDFVSAKLSAQEIIALLQTWQAGGISKETFLYNLQVGEILPPDRTIEKEIQLSQKDEDEALEKALGAFNEKKEPEKQEEK